MRTNKMTQLLKKALMFSNYSSINFFRKALYKKITFSCINCLEIILKVIFTLKCVFLMPYSTVTITLFFIKI